jgi:diaminopimelate decarboxylase
MNLSPELNGRPFLTRERAAEIRERFGTPCYVYDRARLEGFARAALAFPAPFGLTVRYAMKANPSRGILEVFRDLGLAIDASSDHEVERALRAGFKPNALQLTSQMPSVRLAEHVARGVIVNACSGRSPRGARSRCA